MEHIHCTWGTFLFLFFTAHVVFAQAASINTKACHGLFQTKKVSTRPTVVEVLQAFNPSKKMFVTKDTVHLAQRIYKFTDDEISEGLVEFARSFSVAPISNFNVGYYALAGDYYLFGANLEFPGLELFYTLHAEQTLILLARELKAQGYNIDDIKQIVGNVTPCGHCRQFLREVNPRMRVRNVGSSSMSSTIAQLLPRAFGPEHLGITRKFMDVTPQKIGNFENRLLRIWPTHTTRLPPPPTDSIMAELRAKTFNALTRSYGPSGVLSSVGLLLENGEIITGSRAENAAYNPSVTALHAALVLKNALGYNDVAVTAVQIAQTLSPTGVHDPSSAVYNMLTGMNFHGWIAMDIYHNP